jgi:hypothetical protein
MQAQAAFDHLTRYLETEMLFKTTCFSACGRPRLVQDVTTLRRKAERYMKACFSRPEDYMWSLSFQRIFMTAADQRDSRAAEDIVHLGLRMTTTAVRDYFDKQQSRLDEKGALPRTIRAGLVGTVPQPRKESTDAKRG